MDAAGAVEDNDDAFVRAALHALDDQQQTLLDVARLLPAMRVLVDDKASVQQRSTAAAGAKAWLDEYESKQRVRGTAVEPDKAGYLRKVAQSGLATAVRWVVLEGRSLSYFVDRAETDLRGVLRLAGTTCERCKGMGSRRNSFRLSAAPGAGAAGSDSGALNPLNSGKRSYVFAADSSEEADAWVALIRRAATLSVARAGFAAGRSGNADADGSSSDLEQGQRDRCLAWSASLGEAPDSTQYRRRLRGLCREAGQSPAEGGGRAVCKSWTTIRVGDLPLRPVLTVGGAWARVHLRAVWERDMADRGRAGNAAPGALSDSDGLLSTGRAPALGSPLFARRAHASAASSGGFASAYLAGAMLSAAGPAAGGLDAAARARRAADVARRGSAAIPRIEPAASARMPVPPRLRVPAGAGAAAGAAVAAAEAAVTDAAAAAARRLWGFSPGDRADLHQLAIDVGRDCTVVDGTVMAAARLEHVVRALAASVRRAGSAAPTGLLTPLGSDLSLAGESSGTGAGVLGSGIDPSAAGALGSGEAGQDEACSAGAADQAEDEAMGDSDGEADGDGDSPRESEVASAASRLRGTARADAKLTSFVADVLSCSCRTAAGGDAYEALELALRCPSTAVIVPQGDIAAPVVLTVASSLARYTAPPVRVMPLGAVPSHASAGVAAGGRAAELVIPTPPLSKAEREAAKRARPPPPPPGQEARLRSNGVQCPGGHPVFVVADTTLFYRVRALDGRGDTAPDKDDKDEDSVVLSPAGTGCASGGGGSPAIGDAADQLSASGMGSFSDDESDAGPSEADDARGEDAGERGLGAGALGQGSASGGALEELEWQRGDLAFVAAHFRRVFPFGARPGKGVVRVFATCRPGGKDIIVSGDGFSGE